MVIGGLSSVMGNCVVNPSVMATVTCPVDTTPMKAVSPADDRRASGDVLGSGRDGEGASS